MSDLEQAIRERAYHLWLADGCRDGAADAYWLAAQREVLSASLSASDFGTAAKMPEAASTADEAPAMAKTAKTKTVKANTAKGDTAKTKTDKAKTDKAVAPAKTRRRAA